jgi:hypothetical protein
MPSVFADALSGSALPAPAVGLTLLMLAADGRIERDYTFVVA